MRHSATNSGKLITEFKQQFRVEQSIDWIDESTCEQSHRHGVTTIRCALNNVQLKLNRQLYAKLIATLAANTDVTLTFSIDYALPPSSTTKVSPTLQISTVALQDSTFTRTALYAAGCCCPH